jgi:hypothetical protein
VLELSLDLFIYAIDLYIRFTHAEYISHAAFATERTTAATSLLTCTFTATFGTWTTTTVHASVDLE